MKIGGGDVRRFYAPDGAGGGDGAPGGGDPGAAAPAAAAPAAAPAPGAAPPADPAASLAAPAVVAPVSKIKYSSQLAAELREPIEREFGDTETISDLARKALEFKGQLGRAIILPGKDAKPEEVKAFYDKMGIPTTAEGYKYNLSKFQDVPGVEEFAKKYIEEVALPARMTPGQALRGLGYVLADIKSGFDKMAAERQQAQEQFEGKVNELVGGDKTKAQEILNRNKEFLVHQIGDQPDGPEIVKELLDKGLLTNPKLARIFAGLHQRSADMAFHIGSPDHSRPAEAPKKGTQGTYSEAWKARHG